MTANPRTDALVSVTPTRQATTTIGDAQALLRQCFANHRPTDAEVREIAILAALAAHVVSQGHAQQTYAIDEKTATEDLTNCATGYGFVLGYQAATRARR